MDEPPKDPTSRELLERIVSLEAENAHLKERCDDLLRAFKSHLDSNLNDFDQITDLLYPVVAKLFPNFFPMLGKIKEIVPEGYADPTLDTRPQEYKRD